MPQYKILVDGKVMAGTSGPDPRALSGAWHYAMQYRTEGRVTLMKGKEMIAMFSPIQSQQDQPHCREEIS